MVSLVCGVRLTSNSRIRIDFLSHEIYMYKSHHCRTIYSWSFYYDVIKWKHFPRYLPFVRGIHWSPVDSPNKGQCRGALMFSLIWAWKNGWANNRDPGDLRRNRAHSDVTVMYMQRASVLHKFSYQLRKTYMCGENGLPLIIYGFQILPQRRYP